MANQRIYGFDYGKGLAILGMLLAHTFEAGICDWNHDVEMHYLQRIPKWVIVIVSPFALVCMMGLFFTFITSITCTISIMRIEKKGKKAAMAYFLYRFMFGIVLKGVELVLITWWSEYGIFDKMMISFPQTIIDGKGGTLDSIGACGFLVPLIVYYVRKLPFAKKWGVQVTIISVLAVLLLLFYLNIADWAMLGSAWFSKYRFNFIAMILSKVGSGPFMLAQCVPFGLVGGCIGIIMMNTKQWKYLWIYAGSIGGVAVVTALFFLFTQEDPFSAVMAERKPCFVRFLELCVEVIVIVIAVYLSDCEQRSLLSRYNFNKQVTFLRRISVVSLSCFIFEKWVSNQLRKVFAIFVGEPYDSNTLESLWSFWAVGIFMIVNFVVDLYIIKFWEGIQFRFSCEHIIAAILSFIFNKKEEVDWAASNKKIIYGPVIELEKAILESSEDADKLKKQGLTSEIEMVETLTADPEVGTSENRRKHVGDKQEAELMSTLIELRGEQKEKL
ncbi:hypothetical protein JH06_2436 [Blastocystis sp. subtype 4]|uniref:hypothetical protein n=1 Tax=Blastocystis sp. subtype 4 TaxID=944170 RepID=UPI0007119C88|nr:hypothetical protein JH06_2436 [Blastocystis sp. subtype 4]KNB46285.1 hypothetical protein JH06_2436 [Blastocystis sp. subtype 4]|eukprot:XP_014529744.1 hypothetical protein JH06_2436 [Blastocystis sp. subtype 4]